MSEDTTNLLLELIRKQGEDIAELRKDAKEQGKKIDELIALKNRLIAGGVVLSSLFAYIFDWVKDFFGKN